MFKSLKYIKAQMMRLFYLKLSYLSSNIKKKAYYKFVEDGYNDVLYRGLDLEKQSVVFDIGGFKGEFTEEIQKKICECNIYIFEPVKEYFDQIVEKQNNNQKVYIHNFGLGGEAMNTVINKTGSSSSLHNVSNNNEDREEIKIESIITFILSNKIDKIDLMKINIEGGEYELLDSLLHEPEIISSIDTLLIQFHDFIPNAKKQRYAIQKKLSKTHIKVFDYPFIWEKWVVK